MAGAVRGKPGGGSPVGEYEQHRDAVLGMLAKRFPRLDEDERLSLYHEAWARVYDKRRRGERIESLRAYLVATAGGEALNLLSGRRRPAPLEPDDRRLSEIPDERPGIDEQVVVRDQARIARDLIGTLDRRQREVVKLRFDLQLEADEVRAALGLSRRQYQRLMEEGAEAIAERVRDFETGEWSRRQRSLVTACLVELTAGGRRRAGIVSERRRREAQRLVESDPHVAALLSEVRGALRRAAALLPLPALFPDEASAAGGAVADPVVGGADAAASDAAPGRLLDLLATARGAIAEGGRAAKQQALSLYVRAADPALLSSPRPGTAVAAVAASLAVGGGAYGAYEAVSTPPSPSPAVAAPADAAPAPGSTFTATQTTSERQRQRRRPAEKPRRDRKSTRRKDDDALQPTPMPDDTLQPAPAPPPAPPPETGDEFGFEQ